jgi:hypothetical protein
VLAVVKENGKRRNDLFRILRAIENEKQLRGHFEAQTPSDRKATRGGEDHIGGDECNERRKGLTGD